MSGFAMAARVVHVLLLALGIGAAAQLLTMSDALSGATLQSSAEVQRAVRAQLDNFIILSAPVLLLTLGVGWVPLQVRLRLRIVGVAVWAVLGAVSGRWLAPQLSQLQTHLGRALDGLPPSAAGASEWAQLTTVSDTLLVGQFVVGVGLLWMAVTASGPKRTFSGIQL